MGYERRTTVEPRPPVSSVLGMGFDSITVIPRKGEQRVYPAGKLDPTPLHWKNFIQCVRTREKPVSDVEFGLHVQAALNMALLSFLREKVAKFDFEKQEIAC